MPLPKYINEMIDKSPEGSVCPLGAVNVHVLYDVFCELNAAKTGHDARGVNGRNQTLFVEIAVTLLIRRIATPANCGFECGTIEQ